MEQRGARVYQFDPERKKKLKSVDYVSPEKKQLKKEREQAKKDKSNFYLGVAVLLAIIAAITLLKLYVL
jgi:hypothetical protein